MGPAVLCCGRPAGMEPSVDNLWQRGPFLFFTSDLTGDTGIDMITLSTRRMAVQRVVVGGAGALGAAAPRGDGVFAVGPA